MTKFMPKNPFLGIKYWHNCKTGRFCKEFDSLVYNKIYLIQ
jgi:hypothetical protein